MTTIADLKKAYACKRRNTEKAPIFDRKNEMLYIVEYMVGGTTCMHRYKKENGDWVYKKTE
jgi:hypothetical protein